MPMRALIHGTVQGEESTHYLCAGHWITVDPFKRSARSRGLIVATRLPPRLSPSLSLVYNGCPASTALAFLLPSSRRWRTVTEIINAGVSMPGHQHVGAKSLAKI